MGRYEKIYYMTLRKPRSPMTCCLQAGEPGKLMISFRLSPKACVPGMPVSDDEKMHVPAQAKKRIRPIPTFLF